MSCWQTSDIYLASFLIASGHSVLKNILDASGGRKSFVFEPEPPKDVILSFYGDGEQVNALKLFESFQRLKSATYVLNSKAKR